MKLHTSIIFIKADILVACLIDVQRVKLIFEVLSQLSYMYFFLSMVLFCGVDLNIVKLL